MTTFHAAKFLRLAALLNFLTCIPMNGQVFTTIASFTEGNGANPSLVQGMDGNFYGTQRNFPGTVFRVTPSGDLTVLHEFDTSAYSPWAGLVPATDGRFYGIASLGTYSGIFSITPAGGFRLLYRFCAKYPLCPNGSSPLAALIQADNGEFYGTTEDGGNGSCNTPYGCGTIFRMTSDSSLTTLHAFDFSDGAYPASALIQAYDGNVYGSTAGGGKLTPVCPVGCGTVFKLTSAGVFSTLYDFCSQSYCTDGSLPLGVIAAIDGSLYGLTQFSGADCGTIYRINQQGVFRTLHIFDQADGCWPATLVQGSDGNFYGVTTGADDLVGGTIFSITPEGTLKTLYTFCTGETLPCEDPGTGPTGLIQSTDGKFYGSTGGGGADGSGTIFSLDVGLEPFVTFLNAAGKVGETFNILGQGFNGTTAVSLNGTPAQFTVMLDTFIAATIPEGAASGYVTVTAPKGVLESNIPFHVIP